MESGFPKPQRKKTRHSTHTAMLRQKNKFLKEIVELDISTKNPLKVTVFKEDEMVNNNQNFHSDNQILSTNQNNQNDQQNNTNPEIASDSVNNEDKEVDSSDFDNDD